MTAPDTNVEKQARRHSPALFGIVAGLAAVVIIIAVAALWPSANDDPSGTAPVAETAQ